MPEIEIEKDSVTISARIELEGSDRDLPEMVWFRYPAQYSDMLLERSDGLAAGMLLIAMALGEKLTVRGAVSPRLAYGLEEYQQVFEKWFPNYFQHIEMTFGELAETVVKQDRLAAVSAFSGGVDSLYTLMTLLAPDQRGIQKAISHCLFIHGFDVPLDDHDNFDWAVANFQETLQSLGVDLIPCETNLHAFSAGWLRWEHVHGSVLISAALNLSGLIGCFYIPSSFDYLDLRPWGSSPLIDYWLSTETMRVIHHQASRPRIEKLAALSKWEPAQNSLRVCTSIQDRNGVQNCSRCEKCVRTMTMLKVIGALEPFVTFKQPFRMMDILRWALLCNLSGGWLAQTIRYARANNKNEFLPALYVVYLGGLLRAIALKLMPKPIFNWLKRKWYPPEKDPFRSEKSI